MKTVGPRKKDIELFRRKAAKGLIPERAVRPMAIIYNAMRRAQGEIGPGHFPLDALYDSLPEEYRKNWIKKRIAAG